MLAQPGVPRPPGRASPHGLQPWARGIRATTAVPRSKARLLCPFAKFPSRRGQCSGCPLSACTRYSSRSVQDLLHGFDSKPDKLSLMLFEIFKRNYSKDF